MVILLTLDLTWSFSGSLRSTATVVVSTSRTSMFTGWISSKISMFSPGYKAAVNALLTSDKPLKHYFRKCLYIFQSWFVLVDIKTLYLLVAVLKYQTPILVIPSRNRINSFHKELTFVGPTKTTGAHSVLIIRSR